MLTHLRVATLGVIAEASMELGPGLTVITGETGAGKTLLLGGLRLILGEKADTSLIGPHGEQAVVDGVFEADGVEIGVTRVIPREGRSRAYIDGAVVASPVLADRLGELIEIVGQHDQVALQRPHRILELVDSSLPDSSLLRSYRETWDQLREAKKRQDLLGGDEMALRRELDLVAHQASEIDAAAIEIEEDESLEAELSRLRNTEEIRAHLHDSVGSLEAMVETAGELVGRLRKVGDLDPGAGALRSGAESLAAELAELAREVRSRIESVEADPARLEVVEARLTAIGDLKRKYGRTIEEVMAFGVTAGERKQELESLLASASLVEREVEELASELSTRARRLSEARSKAAAGLATRALEHLADVGLPAARLEVGLEAGEPGAGGADHAWLRFASDPGLEMTPAGRGISGGELSRLVLAVRLAGRSGDAATLVFDEVDAGLGGVTALAMGRKLADLGKQGQTLCVTHLPQVAAHADVHYVVSREGSSAKVARVTGDSRVREVTRMLAGLPESEAGQTAAEELLATVSG
jgi:DNA repair protein RecN (Recombination protein N)